MFSLKLNLYLCFNLIIKFVILSAMTYTFYHFGGFTFIFDLSKKIAMFLNLVQGELPSSVIPSSFREWRFRGERPFLLEWYFKSLGDIGFTELDDALPLPAIKNAPSFFEYNKAMSDWIEKDTASRQAFADALARNKSNEDFSTTLYTIACTTGAVLIIIASIYFNQR